MDEAEFDDLTRRIALLGVFEEEGGVTVRDGDHTRITAIWVQLAVKYRIEQGVVDNEIVPRDPFAAVEA